MQAGCGRIESFNRCLLECRLLEPVDVRNGSGSEIGGAPGCRRSDVCSLNGRLWVASVTRLAANSGRFATRSAAQPYSVTADVASWASTKSSSAARRELDRYARSTISRALDVA